MKNLLHFNTEILEILWKEDCGIIESVKKHPSLEGTAKNITGEVFFYQYELDIPFNGEEREVFEKGDVIYWRSSTDPKKFGILLMYGNTEYGDGTKPRTSSPGIKIGKIVDFEQIGKIETGTILKMG